jgi:hypothetical protein
MMTVNKTLDRTRKQAVVLQFEVISRNLPGRAKEHHKVSQLINRMKIKSGPLEYGTGVLYTQQRYLVFSSNKVE